MNKKAKELVKQMTLEEKCSLLSGKDFWHLKGVERLGIPSIMVTDGPHGLRKQAGKGDHVGLGESVKATCFPTASLLASSWDEDLIKKVGEYLGVECLSEEVSVLLGPGANIKRHPLCGRNFEYFSEDPLLSGKMASAWINGIQEKGVGASLKHYVANNQEAFRLVVNAVIDERTLREIYLKSFEIAVKESQPWTVMCSYNQVNGDYLAENKKLLTDVLKKEWQHKGLVVTDWGANNDRVKGLLAGQELEMPASKGFNDKLVYKQVKKGNVDEKILDERVERIVDLILKASNTLKEPRANYNQELHHELARKVAAESMILLKNENDILPIKKYIKVGLIGEFAKKPRYQGSGSSIISPHVISDAYSAFKEVLGENLVFASGYSLETDEIDQTLIDEAVKAVKSCDVVVIMAGLTDKYESEGFDRDHLDLPMNHNALIEAVAKEHNQVIVALANGAPVRMPWLDDIQGLLEQYLGGEASGEALADVCFGIVNPSGKLPETFPNSLEELPSNQNFPGETRQVEYREGQYVGYRYYDTVDKKPLFPFGFGLSYSKFKYSDIQIETKDNSIKIKLTISNESDVSGKEVIQVYVGKKSAKIYRPKKELKAFKKVEISANMSEKVE
ncbi:MAG: glycoside hydrolase family 3 C-terminal domain-containing protein, partial [Candidatus Izemoplasmatales bacterium]